MIPDIDGHILIRKSGYSYPFLAYGVSRADIDFNPRKAKPHRIQHE
jgi:hypothetical protein